MSLETTIQFAEKFKRKGFRILGEQGPFNFHRNYVYTVPTEYLKALEKAGIKKGEGYKIVSLPK